VIVVFFAATAPLFDNKCRMALDAAKYQDLIMAIEVNEFPSFNNCLQFYYDAFYACCFQNKQGVKTGTNFL